MVEYQDIEVLKVKESKISGVQLENIPFGRVFTDHMLEASYENGKWGAVRIVPYQPIHFDPSLAALHYGQAIFEGIKAYRKQNGEVCIFRGKDNFKRFNISAKRMEMPEIPEYIFMEGMKSLVQLDAAWIPPFQDHALYIRPFMFASDEFIGVRPSSKYRFYILLSPTGPYFPMPVKIYVEDKYVRAVPGGTGFAKAAGNYGAVMFPSEEAKRKGYDQILWTDPFEHKWVQECGTMNVFFVIGNKAITPGLENGTILEGVTRMSAIEIMRSELQMEVEERDIHIDEIIDAYRAGELKEVFGTGTAVTIQLVRGIGRGELQMTLDPGAAKVAQRVKEILDGIKNGTVADKHSWMEQVDAETV